MSKHVARFGLVVCVLVLVPRLMAAPLVHPRFELTSPDSGPFPSNIFTVPDAANRTGLRVALPMPNCTTHPSDCEDVAVINTLDGFNVQPRLSVPFDGAIDVHSVTSDTVFLVELACAHDEDRCDERRPPRRIGIDQVVWDALTNTLHVESDELLDQHTSYALIVTRGVRDASGAPIAAAAGFERFRRTAGRPYRKALLDALHAARRAGVPSRHIAVASVFTTQSVTAVMEKIGRQIKTGPARITDFALGPGGVRTVFPLGEVTSVSLTQQTGTAPAFNPPATFPLGDLRSLPGAVGHIAFGRFWARNYLVQSGAFIPPVGTRTGRPAVLGTHDIYFNLVLPSGTPPPDGWPVAIFGTVGGGNKQGVLGPVGLFAATLAQRGIALIAINSVGHGFGPLGSLTVNRTSADPVTFPAGGRGIDQNGDGVIESREGMAAAAPFRILDERDGFQQTVADLMQLVRQIEGGVDVDDDARPDLDPSRIYYVSQSLSAIYGAMFLAVEPRVQVGVLNAGGGARTTRALTPAARAGIGAFLAARVPSLINAPGVTHLDDVPVAPSLPQYHENMPLPGGEPLLVQLADSTTHIIRSPVVNSVDGAMDIQQYLDRSEWVAQSGSPVAYAPYFRKRPLSQVPKRVIVQFALGDRTVPNPASTAMVRAGGLEDRTTLYRHDLAVVENPGLPRDPHGFMPLPNLFGAIARGAQEQIAVFFESDGQLTIHPEPSRFYEVPIAGPLPGGLNFVR
jgi:hypothetical protein